MFAKRLLKKAIHRYQLRQQRFLTSEEVKLRINVHYGIPCTSSILAFDPIQRLLAIGTLDGRIKVVGGDNIEALLVSPKLSPYKYLEFLHNKGLLLSITNENDIQVWNLERRSVACSFQWESNVTAFSVISGSLFMYVGDEYGLISVLKYDVDNEQLLKLHYQLSLESLAEAAGLSLSDYQPVVGVLPQPYSSENRLLIAYESGLIILWDVAESHVVTVQGDKALELKSKVVRPNDADSKHLHDEAVLDLEGKEISTLCWASVDGTILSVGYADGDILFWDTSKIASINDDEAGLSHSVVKLKLSASEKRLPVIVLRWVDNSKSRKHKGQLIVYGGNEIGCEEVVTVLSLEWSRGIETLRCVGRLILTLTDSFSDMILAPSAGTSRIDKEASLFVLLNPGRIYTYNVGSLSSLGLPGKELPVSAVKFPPTIPTFDPLMTVAELFHVQGKSKIASVSSTALRNQKWPLTGGVKKHTRFDKDNEVGRLYLAGYRDGSIRVWDATYPVFSLLFVLTNEGNTEKSVDFGSSVSVVDLCSSSLKLAIGRECGLVQLYNFSNSDGTSFYIVTETKSEAHTSAQAQESKLRAVFNLRKSGVHALKFANNGSKLIVGYECSQVAVLDILSSSVAFITDSLNSPDIPVMSIIWKSLPHVTSEHAGETSPKFPKNSTGEFIFVLTKDGNIYVIDGNSGMLIGAKPVALKKPSTAISIYFIEGHVSVRRSVGEKLVGKDIILSSEHSLDSSQESEQCEPDDNSLDKISSPESLKDFSILLCCKDLLRIYPAKSLLQGDHKSVRKVKLSKPCCWTTVLRKDEKVCGLAVLYLTGVMEIRSMPDLELVKEISLMPDLRWTIKENMERMICSTENGLIALTNGYEVTFTSILEGENDFRLPESLPSLHDQVLAAAADAAISVSSGPKRKQGGSSNILGGFVQGLKGKNSNKSKDQNFAPSSFSHLDDIFMRDSFPEPSAELSIDDIEIDEVLPSSQVVDNKAKDKTSDREKLLDGGDDTKPRVRTREEIIAKYRKAGDASSVAGEARNKLLQRQEKLERITRRTEDMRNEAQEFQSLANELVKVMENRKWYHI